MNYAIIGAGGTGGSLGAYLANGGYDVTLLARGAHLEAIVAQGGLLFSDKDALGQLCAPVKAATVESYTDKADVIFVCVKGYALEDMPPLIKKIAHENSIIIPVLNILGTGLRLSTLLPGYTVLDGCIYISAYIAEPGHVVKDGAYLRVVYGERQGSQRHAAALAAIAMDLTHSGVTVVVSDKIEADCFKKLLFLSPFAATGSLLDATSGQMAAEPSLFLALHSDLLALAKAKGITYGEDMPAAAMAILKSMSFDGTSSMYKDLQKGGPSEFEGLVAQPLREGKALGIEMPAYEKVYQGLKEKYQL